MPLTSLLRLLGICILLLGLLAPQTPALASANYAVNTTADTADVAPGNGLCADSGGDCSLRAAIEETNASAGMDTITVPAGTYTLTKQLVIEDSLFLNGAGMDATYLDGNDASEILKVRTVELLVCDSGNDSVASYDRNGQRNVDTISAGAGGMDIPGSIAFGPEDDLFVAAYSSGVHRFSSTGSSKGLFVDPADVPAPLFAPTAAIFGDLSNAPNTDMYVADYYPGERILRVNRFSGAVSTFVAQNAGGLSTPSDLAFYNDDLYVTSTSTDQVLRYDGDTGSFVSVFVSAGSGGLATPRGLAFRENRLYVANEEGDSILRYNAATGAFVNAFVSSGSGGLDKPGEIVFGPDGNLYVISRGNKSILRYNGTTGAFLGVFVAGGDAFLGNPACLAWRTGAGEGPIVNINGVSLQNGRTMQTGGPTAGLAIDQGASVSLRNSAVRNNRSSVFGGGIQNWGSLDLIDSEVVGNELPEGGGGQTSQGGGIFNAGNLTIERSLIANNFATRGGGISNVNQGRINITNTTISGNRAFGAGGGIRNVVEGNININASTITNNRANEPGGDGESERKGGGIYNDGEARISMANTILAGNTDNRGRSVPDYSPDCYSPVTFHFTSHRDNLVGILTSNCILRDTIWGDTRSDNVGTPEEPLDPRLFALAYNGATLRTHALRLDSPALDDDTSATSATFFDCPPTDQRGLSRPQGSKCDIGAFEMQQASASADEGTTTSFASLPGLSGEVGLSGQLTNAAGGGTLTLRALMLTGNPTSGPLRAPGNRYLQLDAANAGEGDTAALRFFYASSIATDTETLPGFQLLYFDGQAWQTVRGDGGAAPGKDTSDNGEGSLSGGSFSLTLSETSSPTLAQLNNIIFTFAVTDVQRRVYLPLVVQ
jgi:CSLREA domain-containing protein